MNKDNTYTMFLIIVISVNLMVNLYLFFRTRTIFPEGNAGWWLAAISFWLIAFSYVIGRFIERTGTNLLAGPFITIGSWWLGAMVYLTLLFLLADILRGINGLFNATELFRFTWLSHTGKITALTIYGITAIILGMGYYNARIPVVRQVDIQLGKPLPDGAFKIVLVSDMHLGMTISNGKLTKMVNLVNQQKADLILLAGDVFDEDLGPVIQNNMGDLLKNLQAKLGVYAVLGNHEFYGNAGDAEQYLEDHRITVLRDSVAVLPNDIVIIGREDLTYERMSGKLRKPLDILLEGINKSNPLILMDHQPNNLGEAVSNNIDLQVSGHTHNGQMWPFNYITGAIFEISNGYRQINNTQFYISSGYGTWGPPIRTNSRSEIVVLNVAGKNN
jgi:uncharacterized protein